MCGRLILTSPARVIAEAFGVEPPADLAPRWNIAPGQPILAVRAGEAGRRGLAELRWGLVPWWSKEPPRGATLINARSETAATTPAFRDSFRTRRCLVPADGFYEWQAAAPAATGASDRDAAGATAPAQPDLFAPAPAPATYRLRRTAPRRSGPRQPHRIALASGEPFAIAGLWDRWRPRDGDGDAAPLETCALLTTTPNELMAPIHDRMPVILPRAAWDVWLDPAESDRDRLAALLRPFPATLMQAVPVGTWVNDPRHDDARCVAPAQPATGA